MANPNNDPEATPNTMPELMMRETASLSGGNLTFVGATIMHRLPIYPDVTARTATRTQKMTSLWNTTGLLRYMGAALHSTIKGTRTVGGETEELERRKGRQKSNDARESKAK